MAHIPDGMLSAPVIAAGWAVTAGGVALGLKALDDERLVRAGLVSAAFFVASLIAVPVGPTSVHLLFGALAGLVLGWAAFPAILVALILQASLFGFGGLFSLGVNVANIALPGVIAGLVLRPRLAGLPAGAAVTAGALAAAGATALTALAVTGALFFSMPALAPVLPVMAAGWLPLMAAEAAVTGFALAFLLKVRPDLVLAPAMGPAAP